MSFPTFEGILYPDGKLSLPGEKIPGHPVRVLVTFLEPDEEKTLSELGDYQAALTKYEERLMRGEIHWQ